MEEEKKWSVTPLVRMFAVILVLGAIGLGVMSFTTSQANTEKVAIFDDEGEDPDVPSMPFFGRDGFRGFPGDHHGGFGFGSDLNYDTFLADALGITVQELQDAYGEATSAMLDEAVAQGAITEEQADLIKARNALMAYIDKDELYAQALGISVADLQAAQEEGKTVLDLLDELGLEPAAVREAMQAAYEKAVQNAVGAGVITQSQADQILEGEGGFPLFGGHSGFRGHGDFSGDERPCPCCPDTDSETETETTTSTSL
jgi:uncharacterized protein (DUF433 family)